MVNSNAIFSCFDEHLTRYLVQHLFGSNHSSCIRSRRHVEKLIVPLNSCFKVQATERLNVCSRVTSSIANSGSWGPYHLLRPHHCLYMVLAADRNIHILISLWFNRYDSLLHIPSTPTVCVTYWQMVCSIVPFLYKFSPILCHILQLSIIRSMPGQQCCAPSPTGNNIVMRFKKIQIQFNRYPYVSKVASLMSFYFPPFGEFVPPKCYMYNDCH